MMETKKLTYKEWQMLSNLLDGQLADHQKQAVMERLNKDEMFRKAYQELQWTRQLLRNTPERKIPHHFVLTRQMAAEIERKKQPLTQQRVGFRFGYGVISGIAALVFVFLLGMRAVPMMNLASKSVAMEEVSVPQYSINSDEDVYGEIPSMEIMAAPMELETPAEEVFPEMDEETLLMQEAPAEEMEAEPTQPVASPTMGFDGPSGGGGMPPTETPTPIPSTPTATITPTLTATVELPSPKDEALSGEALDAQEEFQPEMENEMPLERMAEEPAQKSQSQIWWVVGMILSGLTAVVSTFLGFHRKSK